MICITLKTDAMCSTALLNVPSYLAVNICVNYFSLMLHWYHSQQQHLIPDTGHSHCSNSSRTHFSLHFNGHFPGGGTYVRWYQNVSILDFIGAKDDGRSDDNWSSRAFKAPVKSSPSTNQHPALYRPNALPVA